jgi:hypothetical protein
MPTRVIQLQRSAGSRLHQRLFGASSELVLKHFREAVQAIPSVAPSVFMGGAGMRAVSSACQYGGTNEALAATAIAGLGFLGLGLATPAFAATPSGSSPGNPSGTGQPSQTCLSDTAPNEPGNASSSPGSPFNEPTATNPGGTGGAHYAGNGPSTAGNTNLANGRGAASQYDVACYHQPAK